MGAEPPSLCCILFGGKKGLAEKARRLVDSYRLELKDITIQERIGEGASSVVYKGLYKGVKVAIKQLKSCGKGSDSERAFRREVLSLMSCVHKNVLKLYGVLVVVSSKGEELWIVTKFMEGGSLQKYLMQRNHLKLREILRIAEDIARGMEFLHSKGIMHMDLKTANVFLDEEGNAVIGDLGVARLANEKVENSADISGTYRWMAPEVCGVEFGKEGGSFSFKSDVYSFGILLWELVTCKMPYGDYNPVQAAVGVVMHGLRPQIPPDCFIPLKLIIEKCWHKDPAIRPNFSEIRRMLYALSSQQQGFQR